jgi:hypothetical protein
LSNRVHTYSLIFAGIERVKGVTICYGGEYFHFEFKLK